MTAPTPPAAAGRGTTPRRRSALLSSTDWFLIGVAFGMALTVAVALAVHLIATTGVRP